MTRPIPLSEVPMEELMEIHRLANEEFARLMARPELPLLPPTNPWTLQDTLKHLVLTVAIATVPRRKEAEEFFARPWYRRLL